jgi:hypothetical protein
MEYDPRMENMFPLRDPKDPVNRAHPRYAGPNGEVAAAVKVTEVLLARGAFSYLEQISKSDEHHRLPRLMRPALTQLKRALQEDVLAEMQRLIEGRPLETLRCQPARLAPTELPPHEQILAGQYGLFALEAAPEERPTLSNGRILCLYMGALLETEEEMLEYRQRHPGSLGYELDTPRKNSSKLVSVAALGAANSGPFANTALLPDTADPAYDHGRINALYMGFDVSMFDKDGQPRTERIAAVVALDNLFAPENPTREVRVDYGDAYLVQFGNPPVTDLNSDTQGTIKTEPV